MRRPAFALLAIAMLASGCTTPAEPDATMSDSPAARPEATSAPPETTTTVPSTTSAPATSAVPSTSGKHIHPANTTVVLTRTKTFDVDWSGTVATAFVCVPDPAGTSCSGPALNGEDDMHQLLGNASILSASGELTLAWDQPYPPTMRLYAAMATSCGDGCLAGYNGTDVIAASPAKLTIAPMNATAKGTTGLLLLVRYANAVPEDVPAYGFVQAPVDFKVTGKVTLTWRA